MSTDKNPQPRHLWNCRNHCLIQSPAPPGLKKRMVWRPPVFPGGGTEPTHGPWCFEPASEQTTVVCVQCWSLVSIQLHGGTIWGNTGSVEAWKQVLLKQGGIGMFSEHFLGRQPVKLQFLLKQKGHSRVPKNLSFIHPDSFSQISTGHCSLK